MKNLFCPWRSDYSLDVNKKRKKGEQGTCVFCFQPQENNDREYYILYRGVHAYVMLNRYPYNAGHLLIIPFEHRAIISDFAIEVQNEIMGLIAKSCVLVTAVLKAEGVNVGINMGVAAGAGIPEHLHVHILPRWAGDTNFMPTLADTKQISFDLLEIFDQLKKEW